MVGAEEDAREEPGCIRPGKEDVTPVLRTLSDGVELQVKRQLQEHRNVSPIQTDPDEISRASSCCSLQITTELP